MSVRTSNLRNDNKIYQTSEFPHNYIDSYDVIDSKIRKFYFLLQDKLIERDLRVTLSVGSSDKIGDKDVLIEFTNDVNPVFLFLLSVTKSDFENLRSDQGLNVEFKDFPDALVNLLDKCKDVVPDNGGRFKLMLVDYCGTASGGRLMDMNKIRVKIIEECAFRNICHLTIDVIRGTELQIQQKLESELCKTKQSFLKVSKFHDEALMKVSDLVEQLSDKDNVIEKLNEEINIVMAQKEEDRCNERCRAENQERMLRNEYDEKIAEEHRQREMYCSQMLSKIENLEKELRLFRDKELEMQAVLHEKEKEKDLIQVELMSKKEENNQLRIQNEKLDSDYHDKEKTVNILRTRLAVAEQELKDTFVLLLDHQNKLDDLKQEKTEFQTKFDLIHSKFEKAEGDIQNVSDELIKANEIILKLNLQVNNYVSKLNEYDLWKSKLEEKIKEKEDDLHCQSEVINKLQANLTLSGEESGVLKNEINCLEKKLTDVSAKLKNKSRSFKALRENFQDHLAEYRCPQKTLLAYRTYLSMPSLLPSEYHRYTNDLLDFVLQDQAPAFNGSTLRSMDASSASFKMSRIVKPYVTRYLKRFQVIPFPVFRQSNAPFTFTVSSNANQLTEGRHLHKTKSCENVNEATEYAVYKTSAENQPQIYSDITIDRVKDEVNDKAQDMPYRRVNGKQNITKNTGHAYTSEFHLGTTEKDNNSELSRGTQSHHASTNTNKFISIEKRQKPVSHDHHIQYHQQFQKKVKNISNLRNTPAVRAPPLTPEQRNTMDSVFKSSRHQTGDLKLSEGSGENVSLRFSTTPNSAVYNKICLSSNGSRTNFDQNSWKSKKAVLQPSRRYVTGPNLQNNYNCNGGYNSTLPQLLEPINASEEFEKSADMKEPSAYFAS